MHDTKILNFARGQVWFRKDSTTYSGSIQGKSRPYVIISSDDGNATNSVVTVLPVTSQEQKSSLSINVPYEYSGHTNVVLCNQPMTVEKTSLDKYMYTLPRNLVNKIEDAFLLAHGISRTPTIELDELKDIIEQIAIQKVAEVQKASRVLNEEAILEIAAGLETVFTRNIKVPKETDDNIIGDPVVIGALAQFESAVQRNAQNRETKTDTQTSSINNETFNEPPTAPSNNPITPKPQERRKRCSYGNRKPHGYWTPERIKEFIHDKETLPLNEIMSKYDFKNSQQIIKAYYAYKDKV